VRNIYRGESVGERPQILAKIVGNGLNDLTGRWIKTERIKKGNYWLNKITEKLHWVWGIYGQMEKRITEMYRKKKAKGAWIMRSRIWKPL
jgi:hypothetical protein